MLCHHNYVYICLCILWTLHHTHAYFLSHHIIRHTTLQCDNTVLSLPIIHYSLFCSSVIGIAKDKWVMIWSVTISHICLQEISGYIDYAHRLKVHKHTHAHTHMHTRAHTHTHTHTHMHTHTQVCLHGYTLSTQYCCYCQFSHQSEEFEPYFTGRRKLLPRHTDLRWVVSVVLG